MKHQMNATTSTLQPDLAALRGLSNRYGLESVGNLSQPNGKVRACAGRQLDLDTDSEVMTGEGASRYVWFIRSGVLRLQRYGYGGRRQVLSLSLPGEIIGYETHLRNGMSIEAATPCSLFRIEKREFDAFLTDDPDLRAEFLRQQQQQYDRLLWLTWAIGALRPDERLSAFLALATRFMPYQPLADGTGVLSMLLSRPDIADLLSTTVETVSRITHRLAEMHVIEIEDPAHFRILDMKKLASIGRVDESLAGFPECSGMQKNRINTLMRWAADQSDCLCAS
jgi:CRP-like cAMP-binding protein